MSSCANRLGSQRAEAASGAWRPASRHIEDVHGATNTSRSSSDNSSSKWHTRLGEQREHDKR